MNVLTIQKIASKRIIALEKAIKSASRTLLEFEIAQSEWDIKNGRIKPFDSAKGMKRYMERMLKS